MKNRLARDSEKSYKEVVEKTASFMEIPPKDVDKIIRKFWRVVNILTIFGCKSIRISGFGIISPTPEHKKNREAFLRIRKKIFNRRSDESDTRKKKKKKRTLLFSEYH